MALMQKLSSSNRAPFLDTWKPATLKFCSMQVCLEENNTFWIKLVNVGNSLCQVAELGLFVYQVLDAAIARNQLEDLTMVCTKEL